MSLAKDTLYCCPSVIYMWQPDLHWSDIYSLTCIHRCDFSPQVLSQLRWSRQTAAGARGAVNTRRMWLGSCVRLAYSTSLIPGHSDLAIAHHVIDYPQCDVLFSLQYNVMHVLTLWYHFPVTYHLMWLAVNVIVWPTSWLICKETELLTNSPQQST